MAIFAPEVDFPCLASHSDFLETNIISRMNEMIIVKQNRIAPIWQISHEPSCSRPMMNVGTEINPHKMKTINATTLRFFSG